MIPLYEPFLNGNEKKYVNDCLDSTWISSRGKYIPLFEEHFSAYIGSKYATAVSNGTVAIHLALVALGIGPGDEVIVPTFTYIASVNPIKYTGATPVFVDSCEETGQMNLDELEIKVTPKTKAVIAVHLYGGCCDMLRLAEFCKKKGLFLIEDAAEALGSKIKGRHVGTFGDIGCFSFFGNKTISTGEGGMVVCQNQDLYTRITSMKSQGMSTERYYWHNILGFNYRMTNIQAAIGLAQIEQIDEILAKKRHIANTYKELIISRRLPLRMLWEQSGHTNGFWLPTVFLDTSINRNKLMQNLKEKHNIETRPAFYPVHTMPMYASEKAGYYPIAEKLSSIGINLPGFPALSDENLRYIVDSIKEEVK